MYSYKLSFNKLITSQNRHNANSGSLREIPESLIPLAHTPPRGKTFSSACFWCPLFHVHKPCVYTLTTGILLYTVAIYDVVL